MEAIFTPTILVVDDEKNIRDALYKILSKEGYKIITAEDSNTALEILRSNQIDLILSDLKMPQIDGVEFLKIVKYNFPESEFILITAYGSVEEAVKAMKHGAFDFILKPLKKAAIIGIVKNALEKQFVIRESKDLQKRIKDQVIGESLAFRQVMEMVKRVAPSSATVLIQGESGTGKEVVSKSIHNLSPRKGRPFVKVSCASIPDTLLESELFGYERGAFTGAIGRKEGRFEWADGGTLFLDEVGEMNVASQVKLLRAIQEGEFERLGGKKTLKSDVRLIAATNIDLIKAVQEKKFREDLYYRLNVITINLPPLRERKDDIPLLISQFLQFFSTKNAKNIKGISKEAIGILMAYNWPGNVRELENVVERAVVLARDEEILNPDHFPPRIFTGIEKSPVVRIPIGTPIDKIEEKVVEETLKYSKGDKDVASKLLGISRRTLYRKIPKKKNSEEK